MTSKSLGSLRRELKRLADPAKAKILSGFFKTGPGQYGEGDVFYGIPVPLSREISRRYEDLPLRDIERLLHSRVHEERVQAVLLLVKRYKKDPAAVFKMYLKNLKWINNWDLVDGSAEHIVGAWLKDRDRDLLYRLAKSRHLWTRRVAMLSCFHYIKLGQTKDALALAELLLKDEHDLMHKAVGWMLRELGKRVSEKKLRDFLKKNAARMPRTALRYAIEKFPEGERRRWLGQR
jgi:3-methyladenine DNA glycosylase AlkD